MAHTEKSVDCNVSHAWKEVLVYADAFVGMVLVDVSLQVMKTERVSFFVLSVPFSLNLQTLVGQMHEVVSVLQVVA